MAMHDLKTNTATRITVGPFFDKTDGVTPETALTVTSCKLTMTVDTGGVPTLVLDTNPTASGGSNDMVHITGDDAGLYDLELTAANLNYVGNAKIVITDAATHCPVTEYVRILPADVYDSLYNTVGEAPMFGIVDQGTAQSISGADVTIRAAAAFGDNVLKGNTLLIKGGTLGNYWQSGIVLSNVGGTDVVTLDAAPTVTPTGTLSYKIIGTPPSVTTTSSLPRVDLRAWLGTAAATPTVAGVPEVDVTHFNGTAGTFAAGIPEVKVQSMANNSMTAAAAAADLTTEIAAGVLTVALTESYAADGAAPTLSQAVFAIQQFLQEKSISSTTMTVKKLDGSTTAMTFTLDSAVTPTSITRAT